MPRDEVKRKRVEVMIVVEQVYAGLVPIYVVPGQRIDQFLERKAIAKAARQAAQCGKDWLANQILKKGEVFYDQKLVFNGTIYI